MELSDGVTATASPPATSEAEVGLTIAVVIITMVVEGDTDNNHKDYSSMKPTPSNSN